jgi:hypothetical protein
VFLFPVVVTNPAAMPIGARIELSATRLSAASGPPALDYPAKSGTPESNRPRRVPQTANAAPAPEAGVLRAQQKKPGVLVTPGFGKSPATSMAECHKRQWRTGRVFAG